MPGWIAYVDESGSGHGVQGRPGRLVLACIAGSPGALDDLAERIRRLKLELAPHLDPAGWELHAGDMFRGRGGSPLGSIGMDRQMAIMRRIVDIMCGSDIVPFCVVVTSARTRRKNAKDTKLLGHAMTLLVERLGRFMQDQGRGATMRVVSDNVREGHRLEMERILGRPTLHRVASRHITGIGFADSRPGAGIQAADAFAYITNRHVGGDVAFEGLFKDIECKARSYGALGGMRIGAGRRAG